ncbi:MAG: DUF6056 family protein [Lentisphaeria bacterium]|nr:DUF6056 family protein [Lentisphaeria bacterium]
MKITVFADRLRARPRLTNGVILLLTAGIFVLFSCYTPYVYDDIAGHYRFMDGKSLFDISPETTPRIDSFSDVVGSVRACFRSWSGRVVTAFTTGTVFFLGKVWFNLLNGVMAAGTVWLICRHICGEKPVRPAVLALVSSLFFLCAPSPGLTLFWASGAITYLWTSWFYLLLLLPYRNFLEYGPRGNQYLLSRLYLLPVGFIGCNANENIAVTVPLLLGLVIVFAAVKYRHVPLWMFYGLSGALAGCFVVLTAPGIAGRIAAEGYRGIPILTNILTQSAHLFHTIPGLFGAVLVMMFFTYGKFDRGSRLTVLFYLAAAWVSGYSMILSPYTPGRAVFGSFVFLLCCAGKLYVTWPVSCECRGVILGICAILALTNAAYAFRDVRFTERICQERFAVMEDARRQGIVREWTFRPVCGMSRYNALYKTDILRDDPRHFLNRHYAKQYGQKSVKTTPSPAISGMIQSIFPESGPK